jgi:hypothetical protein
MVQHLQTYGKAQVGLSLVDNTAYLPLAGGTLTGALHIAATSSDTYLRLGSIDTVDRLTNCLWIRKITP